MSRRRIHRAVTGAIIVVLAVVIGLTTEGISVSGAPSSADVPSICRILGVRLGVDTIEGLERKIGKGAACLGGHPHGGRAWYLRSQRVGVYADGFNYNSRGERILDGIRLSSRKADMNYSFSQETRKPAIPNVRLRGKSIGWLGSILPGMSREQVVKLTQILPKPEAEGSKLIWKTKGGYRTATETMHTTWTAELDFVKDVLVSIEVSG